MVCAAGAAMAQLGAPQPKKIVGAQNLALSPDGSRLAFNYRGDIWVVPSEGGQAMLLTRHVEMDDMPCWSPDGNWIAFSSNRHGGSDIFVIPANGGTTRRLTYHSASESPSSWTPDGKHIVFRSSREGEENAIYMIDVKTGDLKMVTRDNRTIGDPMVSPDGNRVLYRRFGFPWTRPRYHGSAAAQIWVADLNSGEASSVRDNEFQHLWSQWTSDGNIAAVTVSDVTPSSSPLNKPIPKVVDSTARTPNIWVFNGSRGRRVTDFVGGSVRFLTVAQKTDKMAFEYEGDMYTITNGAQPKMISVVAAVDDQFNNTNRQVLTNGADEASLSPNGETFVFADEYDLWSVPVKQGDRPNSKDAERLTEWAGIDSEPLWNPDGKSFYFTSDREGSQRLYQMVVETKKVTPVTAVDSDVLGLKISPDKKHLTFWIAGQNGGMYRVPVAGGSPEKVMDFPRLFRYEASSDYAWSPDGRYLAYSKRLPASSVNIWIYDTQTKTDHNITRIASNQLFPSFSSDGKYLYFVGDREGGNGIWVVPLLREEFRLDDEDLKYTKPESTPSVEIDFDRITERMRMFSSGFASNIRMDKETGHVYFNRSGQIWRVNYDGSAGRAMTSGGGFEFTGDGDSIAYLQDGVMRIMSLRRPNNPVTSVEYRADWVSDTRATRKAAFYQFWREYNRSFYDGNFHGRDWVSIRNRYEPLLDAVAHRNEMATLLNMMIGELEASHTEASAAAGNPGTDSEAHLGLTFDYSHSGPGLLVDEVPRRTPGSYEKTLIKPGEYIMAINGQDVSLNENLWSDILVGQIGRDVTLLVNGTPTKTGAREVRIKAISSGQFRGIVRENEVEDRRRYVEEKSNGQLTYLEIAGMGGGNLRTFNYEAWELLQGKKGIIIDVRFNGGGNISDDLIDLIERRPSYIFQLRDNPENPVPNNTWWDDMETAVLMGETSFSDAEIFPYAMKARGFGTLVGMPTPGYVISTYGMGLVDGTRARMPAWGVYRLDGSNMENQGQQPDVRVPWTADQYLDGVDPQLDRAIEILMRRI